MSDESEAEAAIGRFVAVVGGLVKLREDLRSLASIKQAIKEAEARIALLSEEEKKLVDRTKDLTTRATEAERRLAAATKERDEINLWIRDRMQRIGG